MIGLGTAAGQGQELGLAIAFEPFDSEVLRLRIARITSAVAGSAAEYEALFRDAAERLRRDGHDQVLRRAALTQLPEIWGLERAGFELMDVGVTFARALRGAIAPPEPEGDFVVRASTRADLEQIAGTMVHLPWASRYEADSAYDPADVRELRRRWLWNSHNGRADAMLVGILEGRPAGYVTCRFDRQTGHGEIELVGTLPEFRGRHVASRIIAHAVAWFSTRATLVTVRTQATNYAAAALYERTGFTLQASDSTFRLNLRRQPQTHS